MAMTRVKKTADYCIYKRGDGRFAVEDAQRKPVNGDAKVAILLQEGLVEAPKVKAPEPAAADVAEDGDAAEQAPAESGDA